MHVSRYGSRFTAYALLTAGGLLMLMPFWWMLVMSLSTESAAAASGSRFRLWPEDAVLSNLPDGVAAHGRE